MSTSTRSKENLKSQWNSLFSIHDEYFNDSDRIRDRIVTTSFRRASRSNTSDNYLRDREILTYVYNIPTIFRYDQNTFEEKPCSSIDEIPEFKENECIWIDVVGLYRKKFLSDLGQRFNIHPLVLIDIDTPEQRTKLDIFDDALFSIMKLIYPDRSTDKIFYEQISFYIKRNLLITFQEGPQDAFEQIKNRIRTNRGRIRRSKIDYLFYVLIDTILDRYIDVLNLMNTKLEMIEQKLLKNLSHHVLQTIYDVKREMLTYRSAISPLKEILIKLQKEEETQIIENETIIYFKDLFDHIVHVNETIETHREMVRSLMDFYMMLNTNAMNQVIQTLTIISTIFIPLTFIVGIYGMNFEFIPELKWKFGFYATLILMLFITILMLCWFKKKRWL